MVDALQAGAKKLAVAPDAVGDEARQPLRFASVRAKKFTSTTSTAEVETRALGYLQAPGSSHSMAALVIYGRSGAGKTFVALHRMLEMIATQNDNETWVLRETPSLVLFVNEQLITNYLPT